MTSEETTCVMCRNELNSPCIDCLTQRRTTGCPVVIGECGHKLHKHCIQGWFRFHRNCPFPGCGKKFIPTNDPELLAISKTEPVQKQ